MKKIHSENVMIFFDIRCTMALTVCVGFVLPLDGVACPVYIASSACFP